MTSGYVLITVILFLGGLIAVSGDRVGTKVGKARLTIFKLRPRQTATLVTIVVGTFLSAAVLTVLFAASEQLRTGVFDLQTLQKKLSSTSEELAKAISQKNYIQQQLEKLRIEQSEAKDALMGINQSVKNELTKRSSTAQQLKKARQQLEEVGNQRTSLQKEVDAITRQISDLSTKQMVLEKQKEQITTNITQVNKQLMRLAQQVINLNDSQQQTSNPQMLSEVRQQQGKIRELSGQLRAKDKVLGQIATQVRQQKQKLEVRKAQLQEKERQFQVVENELNQVISQEQLLNRQLTDLEKQLRDREQKMAFIDRELGDLEREYQHFRQGDIVILRHQVMVFDVVTTTKDQSSQKIIDKLLQQANQTALAATHPGDIDKGRRIVQLSSDQQQKLMDQIKDGRQYVVRFFAMTNYLVNDQEIRLFADAALNQKVFKAGEILSSSSADPTNMKDSQLRQQLDLLLSSSQLRARRVGILGDSIEIGNGNMSSFIKFIGQMKAQSGSIDLQAIAVGDTFTAGPLKVKLQALQKGKVIFST
jgi:uncharacterized protein (DUF3084 family)